MIRTAAAAVLLALVAGSTPSVAAAAEAAPRPSTRADGCTAVPSGTGSGVRLDVSTVAAAGTRIAWAEVGSGEPLLLLNGTGSPMAEWDPALLAGLARSRRVIVMDYPGLGLSGPAPSRRLTPIAIAQRVRHCAPVQETEAG